MCTRPRVQDAQKVEMRFYFRNVCNAVFQGFNFRKVSSAISMELHFEDCLEGFAYGLMCVYITLFQKASNIHFCYFSSGIKQIKIFYFILL